MSVQVFKCWSFAKMDFVVFKFSSVGPSLNGISEFSSFGVLLQGILEFGVLLKGILEFTCFQVF